jgi:hypothetical protein
MTTHSLPATALVSRRSSHAFADPVLLIAAELYIAVAIVEAAFIWRALPHLPDIGSFYAFVP